MGAPGVSRALSGCSARAPTIRSSAWQHGGVVSLLARLPGAAVPDTRRCRSSGSPWPPRVAVTPAGLAGLGLALVVVQTLDPAGGLGTGESLALAGRLWLLAQGGELDIGSGPLVLAPLLLTLGIAWGLSRAGRVLARLQDLDSGPAVARATGLLVVVHVLLTVVLALAWTTRRPASGCSGPSRAPPSSESSRSAGERAGSPASSTRRWNGCPAPLARCCGECWRAC